jgi:hypothetical protein
MLFVDVNDVFATFLNSHPKNCHTNHSRTNLLQMLNSSVFTMTRFENTSLSIQKVKFTWEYFRLTEEYFQIVSLLKQSFLACGENLLRND